MQRKSPDGVISVCNHRARQGPRIQELRSQMHVELISPAPEQAPAAEPLRPKDIAAALRVDPSTVYAEIKAGRLSAYRVGTGRGTFRVSRAAFTAYLAARGIPASELAVTL